MYPPTCTWAGVRVDRACGRVLARGRGQGTTLRRIPTPNQRQPLKRAVRIQLECILVCFLMITKIATNMYLQILLEAVYTSMLHLSTKDVCQVFAAAHHLQMIEVTAFVLLSSLKKKNLNL